MRHCSSFQAGETLRAIDVPDPYGGSVNINYPQTFNRYAYVVSSPLRFIDLTGLDGCSAADEATSAKMGILCRPTGSSGSGVDFASSIPVTGDIIGLGMDIAKIFGFFSKPAYVGSPQPRPSTAPNKPGCQAGPLNLSQNIQTTKALAGQFWSGLLSGSQGGVASAGGAAGSYVGLVRTGGPWDPKTTLGMTPTNIAAGNINFGATCSQFGFNTSLGGQACQYGAGIYGKLSGDYGSSFFSRSHGDIPSDNQQIRQGLEIAKKGNC